MLKQGMAGVEKLLNNTDKSFNKEWLDQELSGCTFKDERIGKRFKTVCEQLWSGIGNPIPLACQDWANTKAAYRFFSNERVTENQILKGHLQSTKERFLATNGYVLVLQDTTEFSYERDAPELIGATHIIPNGKDVLGKNRRITKCGILMHASLAVTTEGLPLGLAAIKFWTRKKFKGTNELKKHINPTRMPIEEKESYRWLENMKRSTTLLKDAKRCVHIGDRENDIYEFFCLSQKLGTHFVVRTCVDRLAGDGGHTIADEINEVKIKRLHRLEVRDKKGNISEALLEIRYKRIKVLPPIGKQKKYPELYLTVIHAEERGTPKNREKIIWKLMTNLPITSRKDAIEKLNWYALRWKIELFHKILKSGCKAEDSKLRTAERLTKLISIYCILSWRIFWMTMMNRCCPNASPKFALTDVEIKILDQVIHDDKSNELSNYLIKIARLGGYLNRASDPPPGNIVMWRGLARLVDIQLGFNLAMKIVGN
jgi:Transposase DNA-binding/Transposase DDE domain